MKNWLAETIDQIVLGEFLAKSKVSCGQRFGLIAVDNAIEYMLIAYVEVYKQLVGGHKVKLGGLTKKDWQEKKERFPELLAYVAGLEPNLQAHEAEINRFHTFRNRLYHSGVPTTTSTSRVVDYSNVAQEVLTILFGIKLTTEEWDGRTAQIASSLGSEEISPSIKRQVTFEQVDGFAKFNTSASLTAVEAIALALYGYSSLTGSAPSKQSLIQTLARSGQPLSGDVVKSRVSDLRKNKWLQKNELTLSSKGRKELMKKFIL